MTEQNIEEPVTVVPPTDTATVPAPKVEEQDTSSEQEQVYEEEHTTQQTAESTPEVEPEAKLNIEGAELQNNDSGTTDSIPSPHEEADESTANGTNISLASGTEESVSQTLSVPVHQHSTSMSTTASRARNGSIASSTISSLRRKTSAAPESTTIAFLKRSFENIVAIKEINKKYQDVVKAANKAIEILKTGVLPDEATIFSPLKLACEKPNTEAKIEALDCLGKIFSFNVFNQPIYIDYKKSKPDLKTEVDMDANVENNQDDATSANGGSTKVLLIDAAIQVIISCFDGEGTDEKIELQVIKVLTDAIVNETMPVHGKILLQAIRQIYNVFLLSLSPSNQGIAQATLTQLISTIYDKVKTTNNKEDPDMLLPVDLADSSETAADKTVPAAKQQKLTLQQIEESVAAAGNDGVHFTDDEIFGNSRELYIKDAFLVFRSMSNLAVKVIETESIDMRSHAMRSKLLSLHIIHWILKNYIECFTDKECIIVNSATGEETILVDAVRKYLCLILSRNAASAIAPVYEISLEIYWIMVSQLRDEFKVEIPVFLEEIYFPVSEMKTSTAHQKRYLLSIIHRLTNDPKAIVETYLNYDCEQSMPNLCEKIMDYLDRLALTRADATPPQKVNYRESLTRSFATYPLNTFPQLNVSKLGGHPPDPDASLNFPIDYGLKMGSIDLEQFLVMKALLVVTVL
ncbi:unnamed protein product [Ambrosiozyma monospora]|uniref:Unnamed protein product n=1 Tax=Ambrosiozyma monospora TaxID=43982 RepID=A0A9W6YQH3_AMBMO|nr:unnamed protein product [Ambrosiozyma monospora]